jgi:hypothetical protein
MDYVDCGRIENDTYCSQCKCALYLKRNDNEKRCAETFKRLKSMVIKLNIWRSK